MPRKAVQTENPGTAVAASDLSGLPGMTRAANELAVMQGTQDAAVRAVATLLGYQLPGDCTDPDLICRDIAANMRRSVEACLEVGRGLRVLKEACEHGEFIKRLDVLGIDRKVAVKFMQAATKFSNVSSTRHLQNAIGNQTKLFEMLVLDDEELSELELLGQTGELTLDDVATMSVKELRAALRSLRGDAEAKDAVLARTNEKLTKLQVQLNKKIVADTDWPDALEPISEQVAAAGRKIAAALSELETCRITLFTVAEEIPEEGRPKYEAALSHIAETYELALARAERDLAKERATFEKSLGTYVSGDRGQETGDR
ncbi:MAG: hypothetical protein LBL72_06825 [Candidatus Accumulibacter sp.]|jgi:hypothetical protein|nr:hypothetical protein [Accumulibacter sp.]